MLISLVNGIEGDEISIHDRGLLYGQSLFETVAVANKKPLLLAEHLQRLELGCKTLSINYNRASLKREIRQICQQASEKQCVLRITITMGVGGRGYLNPKGATAQRILSLHAYPKAVKKHQEEGITLGECKLRLAQQPLFAGLKHANRLEQVIARSQWKDNWQEGLLLDQNDHVIEATQSNVFILKDQQLFTPDLSNCGVAGVMRQQVLQTAKAFGIRTKIMSLSLADLAQAQELFLSNSVIGVWPVKQFKRRRFKHFDTANLLLQSLSENDAIPNF